MFLYELKRNVASSRGGARNLSNGSSVASLRHFVEASWEYSRLYPLVGLIKMNAPYWVYIGEMTTPLYIRDTNKLIHALAGIGGNRLVSICCGYDVYQVNSAVISLMANNVLLNKPTIVAYSGESYPVETPEDVISFLRKTKSERFFVSGDIIKSLTWSAIK